MHPAQGCLLCQGPLPRQIQQWFSISVHPGLTLQGWEGQPLVPCPGRAPRAPAMPGIFLSVSQVPGPAVAVVLCRHLLPVPPPRRSLERFPVSGLRALPFPSRTLHGGAFVSVLSGPLVTASLLEGSGAASPEDGWPCPCRGLGVQCLPRLPVLPLSPLCF